jgi:ankyrin repeat protein
LSDSFKQGQKNIASSIGFALSSDCRAIENINSKFETRNDPKIIMVTHFSRSERPLELSFKLRGLLQERRDTTAIKYLIARYSDDDLSEAIKIKGSCERLLLHEACWKCMEMLEVIQILVNADKDKRTLLAKDINGSLPLHVACHCKAPLEVIQVLLENDIEKKSLFEMDSHGGFPLHTACFCGAPLEVIKLLLESDPAKKSLFGRCDYKYGGLPLHLAIVGFCGDPLEVVELLLENDPEKSSLFERDNYGYLPIHVACLREAPLEVIQLLLENDPDKNSIVEKDNEGKTPIDLACEEDHPSFGLVVEACISDRIHRLGVRLWRERMRNIVEIFLGDENNTERETKNRFVENLHWTLENYEETQAEKIQLLELAIWKGRGLSDDIQERTEHWITCGSDVIIKAIVPYV